LWYPTPSPQPFPKATWGEKNECKETKVKRIKSTHFLATDFNKQDFISIIPLDVLKFIFVTVYDGFFKNSRL
jgi:hypothetical protein